MKMIIENIGMVQQAEIDIEGLTIVAGENDTGKSTIGKLFFSVIKAVSLSYPISSEEIREIYECSKIIESIYLEIRSTNLKNKDIFEKDKMLKEVISYDENALNEKINYLKCNVNELSSEKAKSIIDNIEKIKFLRTRDIDFNESINESSLKHTLNKILYSEFEEEFSSKQKSSKNSLIRILEGKTELLSLTVANEKVTDLKLYDALSIKHVTFIESATILQMSQLINTAGTTLLEYEDETLNNVFQNYKHSVPLHIKDLAIKMSNITQFSYYYNNLEPSHNKELVEKISSIIKGLGIFKTESQNNLHYYKTEVLSFKTSNIASGIKSFAILQMLLRSNTLNKHSLLILDEPENHLHPKWQVEYAKIIILLVQNGISVLLTSHSPYMLRALRVFSAEAGLQDKTNFYLAEKTEGEITSIIGNVNDDLNKIFTALATPLHNLIWKN